MSHWPRYAAVALFALALAAPSAAVAQPTPADRAEQLNDEGRKLVAEERYADGANKFRQAIVLSPEGRFYFNLCIALYYMNQFREALTACEAVEPNGASNPLIERTNVVVQQIRGHIAEHGDPGGPGHHDPDDPGYDPDDPGHGDPGHGAPSHGDPGAGHGAGGRPPPLAGVETQSGDDGYRWSLGGEIGVVGNNLGADSHYAGGGASFRGFINFPVLSPSLGVQGFLGITHVGRGSGSSDPLQVLDLGGAIYGHLWNQGAVYLTALGGVQAAFMQPEQFSDEATLIAMGIRGELQGAYRFGPRKEHGITATLGLTIYTAATELTSGAAPPRNFGLDKSGNTLGLTFGYIHHFSTPFGSTPIIVLE